MTNSIAASNLGLAVSELFDRFTVFYHAPTIEAGRRLNVDVSIFLMAHASTNTDPVSMRKLFNVGRAVACWLDNAVSATDVDMPTYCEHLLTLSF